MKKKLLVVCCSLALVLSACGGSSNNSSTTSNSTENQVASEQGNSETETSTENADNTEVDQEVTQEAASGAWTLQQETDEFGDVKKDGSMLAVYEIKGTFSNTATNGSELGGTIVLDPVRLGFSFNLHEYNDDTNATYLSSDSIILKYKTGDDDTIKSHYLGGKAPNAAVVLADSVERMMNEGHEKLSTDSGFIDVGENLWYGNVVKCIIEIGSSSYNFNIEPSNFKEVTKSMGLSFEKTPKEEAIPQALQAYLDFEEYKLEVGNPMAIASSLLINNLSDDDMIPDSEYENLMVGHWAYYDFFCTGQAACVEIYEDGTWGTGGWIYPDKHEHKDVEDLSKWSVEDGKIKQLTHTYKLYDTGCDGYYFLYCVDEGKSEVQREISSYIMVKIDDNCETIKPPIYE